MSTTHTLMRERVDTVVGSAAVVQTEFLTFVCDSRVNVYSWERSSPLRSCGAASTSMVPPNDRRLVRLTVARNPMGLWEM